MSEQNLNFNNYKNRGPVLLNGVPDIMEAMEETQMNLGGMMSSRYVMPFKEEVSGWVMKMSTVSEIEPVHTIKTKDKAKLAFLGVRAAKRFAKTLPVPF